MQDSWLIEEGGDGASAGDKRTQSHSVGSISDKIVTPSSAHSDNVKSPDPNLLVDIGFDPPHIINYEQRRKSDNRARDIIYGHPWTTQECIPGQPHNGLPNWPQDCSLAGRSS